MSLSRSQFPMVRRLLLVFLSLMPVSALAEKETVVLLHGLGLSGWAMTRLGHTLERDGYRVLNLSYPSRRVPLETLARDWLPAQLRAHDAAGAPRLHFVTHSMGGILVRCWLDQQLRAGTNPPANLGRVVMLAPPNHGSEAVDRLQRFPPFRWFFGANGTALSTAATALPRTLGPWSAAHGELGIIAGDRSLNPLLSSWVPSPNDGPVSVASTHLQGANAHRLIHASHTAILWRADTAHAASTFLRTGRFE